MTQRAMGVTMLKTFAGLEPRECAAAQCRNSRIKQDNTQMAVLGEKIDEFCNPFADDAPAESMGASGRHNPPLKYYGNNILT